MNLKNKVFGFVADAALTLSMVGGAAAQDTDTVGASVTLSPGACNIELQPATGDFGVFKYVDGSYVRQSGSSELVISGTLFAHRPGGTCNLTAYTTGLVLETGSRGNVIPSNNFSVDLDGVGTGNGYVPLGVHQLPGSVTVNGVQPGAGNIGIRMDSVPDNFAPGRYSGVLDITVTNAD